MIRKMTRTVLASISVAGIMVIGGCSSMFGDRSKESGGLDTRAMRAAGYSFDERGAQRVMEAGESKDGRPAVILEVRDKKRHLERIPLSPDKPTFVQDLIDDAKLIDRIGRIQVVILRPTGSANPPIRMNADFDPETKRIVTGQNYAIQPNDQIIVSRDTRNWLEKFSFFPKAPSR
ncbi:MAG: hypothetical protein SGI77_07645 [Pirellulaceae bacterium]|nr:hypothetical protein [Pirellulaceae bacterium]